MLVGAWVRNRLGLESGWTEEGRRMAMGNQGRGKPPTRDDVAALAGVSSAVVSYVVNDGPRPVAESTRQKVLEAVRQLRYKPNEVARAFRLQRTNTLGLLVPDIRNSFFAELARMIQDAAHAAGYTVVFTDTGSDPKQEFDQIHFLAGRHVDGALIIGHTPSADFSPFRDADVPFVTFDRFDGDADVPTVVLDDYRAARTGLEHLLAHGHTRIAYLGGNQDLPAARARRQAWIDMTSPSSADLGELASEGEFSRADGYRAAKELVARHGGATALFVASDAQAVGALRALAESGLRVPDDIAVLSFDGTQESEFTNPPLSVVRQPLEIMASEAVNLVLRPVVSGEGIHRIVPHQLILRESCGCVTTG